MTEWQEEYRRKTISAEEAAGMVKNGDFVVFATGRETYAIGMALAARKEQLKGVRLFVRNPFYDFGWYAPGWENSFYIAVGQPSAICQQAVDEGRIDIVVGTLVPMDRGRNDRKPDVVLIEVSAPDERGFCSFGNSVWDKRRLIMEAKLVIAEVNKKLIRTYGDNYVHVSELDYLVEHISTGRPLGTGTLAGRVRRAPAPYLKDIVGYVADLLRDGDTLQIGIGQTTEPLVSLGLLEGRKDMGYHSEATTPGIIGLVRQGVINGSRKTLHPGKVVVTSLGGGTKEEMEWANMNPLFLLVDVGYLEDIRIIAANDNMVAINNALAVDLSGQIAAESIGRRLLGQAGGQIPFAIGATMSNGGRSITCLPSTAKEGTVSRIVPFFPPGTLVTIHRNLADYVVTEYGMASLKGKSVRQRVDELINIAHPHFRQALRKEAHKLC